VASKQHFAAGRKNKLAAVMAAHSYRCTIENIVGQGRARGFSVSCREISELKKLYYYESDEFLDKGKKTKKFKRHDEITVALIVTDFQVIECADNCVNHDFIQPNKDAADAVDIGGMMANAEIIFSGEITNILSDRINYTHYYVCALKNPAMHVFIESRTALDLAIGQAVHARGTLSARILT
jgi:hypothetical protein